MSSLRSLWTCVGDPLPPSSHRQISIKNGGEWECSPSVWMHSASTRTEETIHRCSDLCRWWRRDQTSVQAGRSAEETSPAVWLLTHCLILDFILISLLCLVRNVCLITLNITRKVFWSSVGKWRLTLLLLWQSVSVSDEWKCGNA